MRKVGRPGGIRPVARETLAAGGVSGRALAIAGAAVLLVAVFAFGAWQLWRAGRRRVGAAYRHVVAVGASGGPAGAVPAIAATVPDDIRSTGRLVIGVNVPYAPNEFKDSDGEIVGFDVDLMNAMAKTLGTDAGVPGGAFRGDHPAVRAGTSTSGCRRSPTPRSVRRRSTSSPTSRRGRCGRSGPGRRSTRAACGLRVGVASASTHETDEIPAKSDAVCGGGPGADREGGLRPPGRPERGVDRRGDRRDVGRFPGDGIRDQAQRRRARGRGRGVRYGAVRLAGGQEAQRWRSRCARRWST